MSGIKYECKRAIGLIKSLIKNYKPIIGDGILHLEYRQQMIAKIDEIKDCLKIIISLNSIIITEKDIDSCFYIDFEVFDTYDEILYNKTFLSELVLLKEKIKKELNSLPY